MLNAHNFGAAPSFFQTSRFAANVRRPFAAPSLFSFLPFKPFVDAPTFRQCKGKQNRAKEKDRRVKRSPAYFVCFISKSVLKKHRIFPTFPLVFPTFLKRATHLKTMC